MSRGRAALGVVAAGAAVGAATAAWGSLVERRRFGIRWETVPVLPEGSRDVTVLHLSDIHMAPWQADKQQWLRDLSLVEPDFVVNTGDNLGHPTANAAVEYALEPFRGVPGAFAHGCASRCQSAMRAKAAVLPVDVPETTLTLAVGSVMATHRSA